MARVLETTVLIVSVALFALAALGGVFLTGTRVQTGNNPPQAIALAHGGLAALGLVVLLVYVFQNNAPMLPSIAAVLLVVAALGGFVLFATHLRGILISIGIALVHALVAVAGVVLLIAAVVGGA